MHLFVTLQLFIDYNKEKVEQRRSPGSSQAVKSVELSSWVMLVEAQNKAEALKVSKRA